jgi:hypothetical protein
VDTLVRVIEDCAPWVTIQEAARNVKEARALPAPEPAPPEPSPEAIEAAARLLWQLGNVRIGARVWESVSSHYLTEARDALRAAYAVDFGGSSLPVRAAPHPETFEDSV